LHNPEYSSKGKDNAKKIGTKPKTAVVGVDSRVIGTKTASKKRMELVRVRKFTRSMLMSIRQNVRWQEMKRTLLLRSRAKIAVLYWRRDVRGPALLASSCQKYGWNLPKNS
jgi:hypothetical protein